MGVLKITSWHREPEHTQGGYPVIYLDNAATSHPKPEQVFQAAREAAAALFGLADSARAIFTASATDSLNLGLKGLLRPGDHVITTTAEHNALRRPLAALEQLGVAVTWLPVSPSGLLDPDQVRAALRLTTRLIATHHGSNVTGALQPVEALGEIARRPGVLLLVDAAQTAGIHPIHMGQQASPSFRRPVRTGPRCARAWSASTWSGSSRGRRRSC